MTSQSFDLIFFQIKMVGPYEEVGSMVCACSPLAQQRNMQWTRGVFILKKKKENESKWQSSNGSLEGHSQNGL